MPSFAQQEEQLVQGKQPLVATISDTEKFSHRQKTRKQAKIGLTLCLGLLVATGFSKSKTGKHLHVAAGTALVGLSIWHHSLYPRSGKGKQSSCLVPL